MVSFGKNATAELVAQNFSDNIKGKTVIITGPSPKSLGAEAARVISLHQPKLLILAGRSEPKLRETIEAVTVEGVEVKPVVLDLADLDQVKRAAGEVRRLTDRVDVLINNAGIMAAPYNVTAQGHESQFGTNYLGHFLFTVLLSGLLLPRGRVVNITSNGHCLSPIRFDDPGFSGGATYDKWAAYGQAKTANMLFSLGLKARYGTQGLTAFSVHPGSILTNLGHYMVPADRDLMRARFHLMKEDGTPDFSGGLWKSIGQGAAGHIRAAFDPDIARDNGAYIVDCRPANDAAEAYALDLENAQKLWALSEELVGVKALPAARL